MPTQIAIQFILVFKLNRYKIPYIPISENNVPLPENTNFLRYTDGLMEDDFEILFDGEG